MRIRRETRHYTQENPKLVLEMLFREPSDAAHLDSDLCKRILLSYNAVYSVKMLDPLTPQTREIGVGLDLGMASVKELVNVFASMNKFHGDIVLRLRYYNGSNYWKQKWHEIPTTYHTR